MTRDDLLTVVRRSISEVLGIPPDEVAEGADLRADQGVDSLELLEICTVLENALQVEIDVDQLRNASTPGDVADYLHESFVAR